MAREKQLKGWKRVRKNGFDGKQSPSIALKRNEVRFAQDDRGQGSCSLLPNNQPITFFSRSAATSASARPASSFSTVSVCSPSDGGGRESSTGVSEKR